MRKTIKLTVSLPKELILEADRISKKKKISRSKLISACLQDLAERQKAEDMAEGYMKLAEEQKKFADSTAQIIPEVLPE